MEFYMKSLKNHLSVIFPLIVILLSLEFTFTLERVVKDYAKNLAQDYSIVVVSEKKISEKTFEKNLSDFQSSKLMDTKKILDSLKDEISSKNLLLLKVSLPKFYSIKLRSFPTTKRLQKIRKYLLKIDGVTQVETFSKTHDKIYNIFVIAKTTAYIFTVFVLIISYLLMLKQMRIWVYEHKERMEIMTLFGSPFWMKSITLYRSSVINSIIATLISAVAFAFVSYSNTLKNISLKIGVTLPKIPILHDSLLLLGIAIVFAMFSVSLVMFKIRKG